MNEPRDIDREESPQVEVEVWLRALASEIERCPVWCIAGEMNDLVADRLRLIADFFDGPEREPDCPDCRVHHSPDCRGRLRYPA